MELINRLKQNFTINYQDYEGNTHFVKIPFKFLQRCPNKYYLTCLLKYKKMYGWNVVDDYLLAWFHENLTGECGTLSNALEGKGNYAGLWKFEDILCNGVRTKLVNKATRLPHGWIWVKSPKPQMNIVKFRFTDENFYKIEDDDVSVVTTFNFYNNGEQKICEIKEKESKEPFREAIAEALGLKANDKNLRKIINKSIRKAKSDKTFAKIPAFKIDGLETNQMSVQKERKINFIRKINTTEGFWELYLDDEKIPHRVFNIEGYRLFCTGFPRPFIPPSIENNRWVRIFTSVETVGCTQAYDMWMLQSDLKKFYKHMIISGEGRALVECLGLHVDNTPERVRAANIIKKFYKGNRMKKGQFNILSLFKRMTSIGHPGDEPSIEDEESEDEWETNLEDHLADADDFCKTMSKKLKREKSEEERQIENAIENDKNIINLKKNLQRVTSLHNSVSNRVNMINKYIIGWEKTILGGNEKKYFHIWWFLCFGKKFFTHYKGNVVGGKKKFYKKDTAKYLAEGDMIFIFEEFRDCINHFQSLVKTIKSTLKIWKNLETTEKIGYTNLTKKQKNQVVKSGGLFNKQDKISKEHAYEDLSNIMNDSAHLELYFGIGGGGSYADALSLLKNLPDIKTCCIQIVKGLKKIVKEKETFIKGYLKDINELNDMITIQKELIKDSYKY